MKDSAYCPTCWDENRGEKPTLEDDHKYVPKAIKTESKDPNHYGQGQIECIEYIRDTLTDEELIGYYRGNIIKYSHRWRYKDGVKDLKKAQEYLGWLIELVKGNE